MTDADEVVALVAALRPKLAGKPPETQVAALADLVALWLARYVSPGGPVATERYRKDGGAAC